MLKLKRFPNRKFFIIILFIFSLLASCIVDNTKDKTSDETVDDLSWIDNNSSTIDTTIYFVSTTGNNNSDGKSENRAFKTIARALKAVKPGGTVYILPGTYSENMGIQNFGNKTATTVISGYKGIPVLDGQNNQTIAFFCENCMNIIFQDLKIQNYTDIGIGASLCEGIIFRNLTVLENGHKIKLVDWELEGYGIHVEDSDNIIIEENIVYKNGPKPQIIPDYIMGTGINTYGNRNTVIKNNKSYENIGGGILVEDSYDVLVEGNEVYKNDLDATEDGWWDGGFWLDGGGDVIVRDNIFRDNLGPGIEISDEDLQQPKGYVLENNICTNNYYGILIWNLGTDDWPDTTIIKRSGNQFTNNSRRDIWIVDWYDSLGF